MKVHDVNKTDPWEADAQPPPGRLAVFLVRRRWGALLLAGLGFTLASLVGVGVTGHLSSGGSVDPDADSAQVGRLLSERFGGGVPNLIMLVEADTSLDDPEVVHAGRVLTRAVANSQGVAYAHSYWSTGVDALRSPDQERALIVARLIGTETQVMDTAGRLIDQWEGRYGPLQVSVTGSGPINHVIEERSARDLARAELITLPITGAILLIAFGTMVAAGLPLLVGVFSIAGTFAVLRLLAAITDVSIFALNITTALGFGLAVDFSLFLVTRFREETAAGQDTVRALDTTLRTAGRTVLFSALTVMLSLSALLVFPMYFLRSLAYAGIAVVAFSAVGALFVLPAALAVLGPRVHAGRLPWHKPPRDGDLWHRLGSRVMRRPLGVAVLVTALLVLLALPFLGIRFGVVDHRALPPGDPIRTAAEQVTRDFPVYQYTPVTVVLPDLPNAASSSELRQYVLALSRLPYVTRVDSAIGTFHNGRQIDDSEHEQAAGQGAANQAIQTAISQVIRSQRYADEHGTWIAVSTDLDPSSRQARELVTQIRQLPAPAPALVGGETATLVDALTSLRNRAPWAAAVIIGSTLALLFLFTGGLLVPFKAVGLNLLSLTATFGALVFIFQEGHLSWLVGEFTPMGFLEPTLPTLMFCVAFGLSMDYEVFLLSRITEEYRRHGDNGVAVMTGLARTGRLITAAALVVAVALGGLATSAISALKMIGVGLALAVLVDATLVRGLLAPAVMRLAGRANWWAPGPLRRLHARFAFYH